MSFRAKKTPKLFFNREFFLKSVNSVKDVKNQKESLESQYSSITLQLTFL